MQLASLFTELKLFVYPWQKAHGLSLKSVGGASYPASASVSDSSAWGPFKTCQCGSKCQCVIPKDIYVCSLVTAESWVSLHESFWSSTILRHSCVSRARTCAESDSFTHDCPVHSLQNARSWIKPKWQHTWLWAWSKIFERRMLIFKTGSTYFNQINRCLNWKTIKLIEQAFEC